MADAKISALPAASTPLAGTEVLPIVQSGVTDKVSVANLTAGRAVSAASLTLTTTPLAVASGGTGLASFTANGIVYASGTTTLASGSALTFNGTNLTTTGSATAASFIPTSSTVPANGLYLSAANTLAWATNSTVRLTIGITGLAGFTANIGVGGATPSADYGIRMNTFTSGSTATDQYGIFIDAFGTTSATSSIVGVRTRTRALAGAFTASLGAGLYCEDGSLGASSGMTTQVGVWVSDLTIGTNNRALDLRVSAGANKHNIYAATAAANYFAGDMRFDKTITSGGTTGAQTINKNAGSVNFAAAATSLVVTNNLVTTSSVIICTIGTNDATMRSVQAVAGSGSFTIYANAAATAETRVNFIVIN